MKICIACGIEKDESEFHNHIRNRDGKNSYCKECKKKIAKEYRERNRDLISSHKKETYKERSRKWNESEKKQIALKANEYYHKNKETISKRAKIRREKNRELKLLKEKHYREVNRNKFRLVSAKFYKENKEICTKRSVIYNKKRRKEDPNFKLKTGILALFRTKLLNQNIKKSNSYFLYTGILMSEYLNHFKNDPLWSDYSNKNQKISVDHIIPCALFDFSDSEEIKKCWNPRNLRLLPAKENILKSNKFIPELIEQYKIHDLLPAKLTSI